jgi:hypothetical protein
MKGPIIKYKGGVEKQGVGHPILNIRKGVGHLKFNNSFGVGHSKMCLINDINI